MGLWQVAGPLFHVRRAGAVKVEARSIANNDQKTRTLVLVRHGESEWNRRNLFTGWCNPDLTEKGLIEALVAARMLRARGIAFDVAYTSQLKRAQRTLDIILSELGETDIPIQFDEALNERHYGDLCGLNKDEAKERWGEEQVRIWRRSYDIPPPGGESLKDTEDRVMPYYRTHIWPDLEAGKSVLVVAHGNSLRALIMNLENLTGEEILSRELATGAPIVYSLGSDGAPSARSDLLPSRSIDAPPEDIV
jgi:2,3-bisphosphoglycerate-dependent phosphoglycerate mutase